MIRAKLKYDFWSEGKFDDNSLPDSGGFGFNNTKIVLGRLDITGVVKTGIEICGSPLEFLPFVFDEEINGCYAVALTQSMIKDLEPLNDESAIEIQSLIKLYNGEPHQIPISVEPNQKSWK